MAIDVDELSEEEIEAVVNTRGFQKMLAYRRLSDGIEVLEDEDQIFESMVSSITNQHSQVRSEDTTRELFQLFLEEVQTFTDGLTDDEQDADQRDLEDMIVDDSDRDD